MIILGIDPGFSFTGFSIIKYEQGKLFLLDYGYLKMSSKKTIPERISIFYHFFKDKILDNKIEALALETPFLGKNARTFLTLGYLRGILFLLTNEYQLILHEFSPREVKQLITGYGNAEKTQVARVVLRFFPTLIMPEKSDVTDALAVTLSAIFKSKTSGLAKR